MWSTLVSRMLNWEASLSRNKPERIVESLAIREGQTIADIGAGGGYFTLEFARRVGAGGKVYAVDVEPRFLAFIMREADRNGLDNVIPVTADPDGVSLPEAAVDLAFARNVFHHLPDPEVYFRRFKSYVKPGGRVAIIEHKPVTGLSFVGLFKHYTPEDIVMRDMEYAGYFLLGSFDFLPKQSFNIFGMRVC